MIAKLLDLKFRSLTAYFLSYRIVRNFTTPAPAEENYHISIRLPAMLTDESGAYIFSMTVHPDVSNAADCLRF